MHGTEKYIEFPVVGGISDMLIDGLGISTKARTADEIKMDQGINREGDMEYDTQPEGLCLL